MFFLLYGSKPLFLPSLNLGITLRLATIDISILPVVSKVAEKVVFKQLTSYLNTAKVGLHCMQFCFRVNHSAETATLHLTEEINVKLNKGLTVGAIFLDLCKAFDTVNHNVYLSRLSKIQFSPEALAWISSYTAMFKN